jgi:two-component system NarL family sensor kinase
VSAATHTRAPLPNAAVPWTVVTAGKVVEPPDAPVTWRRIVAQGIAAALVVFMIVAAAGTVAARNASEKESVNVALQTTGVMATSVVEPALESDLISPDPARAQTARDHLDKVIHERVLDSGGVMRVKIWDRNGKIIYSDEPRLVGDVFPLEPEERQAMEAPTAKAAVTNLRLPENRFEAGERKLLEVYRPVWLPDHTTLLFETYSRYDQVTVRSGQLWRGFAGITLTSLLLLMVCFTPLVWALVARLRRSQRQHDLLRDRAISASEQERRRIAATLHDGVVQELAGVSFVVAGAADRARSAGDDALAGRLQTVAGTVRASIGGLRSLLVDIYPATLRDAGLSVALTDLIATLRSRDIATDLELPDELDLPPQTEALVFRVAQEVLRNVAKHSRATSVSVRLRQIHGVVLLDIADDGAGFDVAEALANPPEGHLGMRLLADAAAEAGATLSVASAPAHGTRWRLEVPAQ